MTRPFLFFDLGGTLADGFHLAIIFLFESDFFSLVCRTCLRKHGKFHAVFSCIYCSCPYWKLIKILLQFASISSSLTNLHDNTGLFGENFLPRITL